MTDQNPEDTSGEQLEALIEELDAMPPEVVRKALIEQGGVETALHALADLAKNASDPAVRQDARRFIEERQLGFVLLPTTDETDESDSTAE